MSDDVHERLTRAESEIDHLRKDMEELMVSYKEIPLLIHQMRELTEAIKGSYKKLDALERIVGNWKIGFWVASVVVSSFWALLVVAIQVWGIVK